MKYVCTGATLQCTMGTSCPKLIATPKHVSLTGKDQANVADYASMKNIPSFGRCRSLSYPTTASATAANHGKLTPMPCVPGTCPKWQVIDKDSLVCGEPALLEAATLKCVYGGTISIINPGQSLEIKVRSVSFSQKSGIQPEEAVQKIPEKLLQEFNALDRDGLTQQSFLDGVQMTLDVLGMAPGIGAIPDLLNAAVSVLRGDWVGAGVSIVAAVPGVGDVVGGAKIAYRGAKMAKSTQKVVKNPKTTIAKPVSGAKTTTKHKTDVYRIERKKVVGRNDRISVRKETYEVEIRDSSSGVIRNSIGGVGGGTNSWPSYLENSYNVPSVKSTQGVTDGQSSFFGGTPQKGKHGTQSKSTEVTDINQYREQKNNEGFNKKDYEMTKNALEKDAETRDGKNWEVLG